MIKKVTSAVLVCDGCGETFHDGNDFCSYIDDESGELIVQSALDSEWRELGGRHYCPDCCHIDDEDRYHTADGRVWDAETGEEVAADGLDAFEKAVRDMMAPYVDLPEDIIRKNAAQLAALCRREGPVWRKCEKPFDTPGNTGVNSENVVLNGYYISWEDLKRLPRE